MPRPRHRPAGRCRGRETASAGSIAAGIANLTCRHDAVRLESVSVFDNDPDLAGFVRLKDDG